MSQQSIHALIFIMLSGVGIIIYRLYYEQNNIDLQDITVAAGVSFIVVPVCLIFLLVQNLYEIEKEMRRIINGNSTSESRIKSPYYEIKFIEQTLSELKKTIGDREQKLKSSTLTQEMLSLILSSVENIVQNVHDEILAIDENSAIKFFNKAAEKLFDISAAEAIGSPIEKIVSLANLHEEAVPLGDLINEVRTSGKEKQYDIKSYLYVIRRDGVKIPVAPTISLTGELGGSKTIVFVFKRVEAELEIQKLRDEFVFIAAHEIRSPVAIINGYLELLEEQNNSMTEQMKKDFGNIKSANLRLSNLVDDLLEVARVEASKLHVEVKPTNSGEIIQETIKHISPAVNAKKQKVIDASFPPIESPLVLADPSRLREIFMNILSNAIKYTQEGGVITIKQIVKDDHLITSILDTGIGIPAKDHKNVFEKFWRSEKSRSMEGTGLGLFIVKQLIDRMNGKIWFESEDNKGTIFYFSLPLMKTINTDNLK